MTNPTANHPLDDLAAYAVDALDTGERAAVDDHLAGCLACRAELVGHIEALASLTGDERPPPAVWERIAADIGAPGMPVPGDANGGAPAGPPASAPASPSPSADGSAPAGPAAPSASAEAAAPVPPPVEAAVPAPSPVTDLSARRSERTGLRPRIVAALAAAAVVLVAFGFALGGAGGDDAPDTAGELAQQALDEGADVGTLDGTSGQPVARVVDDGEGTSFILMDDLDALPQGRSYQLWSLDGPQPVSLGLLGDGSADAVAVPLPAGTSDLAISDEPSTGAIAPTGPIVATGTLA